MVTPPSHSSNLHGQRQNVTVATPPFQLCKRFGLEPFTDNLNEMQTWPEEGYSHAVCDNEECLCWNCGRRARVLDTIVIAVDGACRQNGKYTAEATYAVYVNERSAYNKFSRLLQISTQPTSQKAELWAGYHGIMTGIRIARAENLVAKFREEKRREGVRMGKTHLIIIIKADSEYLVKGMTDWIAKWKSNGWMTSKGASVANRELFEKVQGAVDEASDAGIEVQFWHVGRVFNKEADELANMAFDVDDEDDDYVVD